MDALDGALEELDSGLLVDVGVLDAGVALVASEDVDGLEDSEDADSAGELVDGVAVALAPRLSFL